MKACFPRMLGNKSREEPVRVKITSCSSFGCCEALGSHAFGRDLTERWIIGGFRSVWSWFLTTFSFPLSLHIFPCILLSLCSVPSSLFYPIPSFPPALGILIPCHGCSKEEVLNGGPHVKGLTEVNLRGTVGWLNMGSHFIFLLI